MFTTLLVTHLTSLSSWSYYWVLQSNIYYLTFRKAWLHIVLDFCLYLFIIILLLPFTVDGIEADHDNNFLTFVGSRLVKRYGTQSRATS
jgi:hypothetical protein